MSIFLGRQLLSSDWDSTLRLIEVASMVDMILIRFL